MKYINYFVIIILGKEIVIDNCCGMFMNKLTFLTKGQVFGANKIDIIKQYGSKCSISDFAILLDGFVLNSYHVFGGYGLEDRTGMWFTKSSYNSNSVFIVDHRGCKNITDNLRRQCGARPVLLWDSFNSHLKDKLKQNIFEIEHGEYPQCIVSESFSRKLELLYDLNELNCTGKIYTLDSARKINSNALFMARDFVEYEYEGKKYIRFVTDNSYCNGNLLSDGRKIYPNYVYWIKVEAIKWIIDLDMNIGLSKNILFSGIQYNNYNKSNSNFEESDIYIFMNEIFINDIIPSKNKSKKLIKNYR